MNKIKLTGILLVLIIININNVKGQYMEAVDVLTNSLYEIGSEHFELVNELYYLEKMTDMTQQMKEWEEEAKTLQIYKNLEMLHEITRTIETLACNSYRLGKLQKTIGIEYCGHRVKLAFTVFNFERSIDYLEGVIKTLKNNNLTAKERHDIYRDVLEDLEKGQMELAEYLEIVQDEHERKIKKAYLQKVRARATSFNPNRGGMLYDRFSN